MPGSVKWMNRYREEIEENFKKLHGITDIKERIKVLQRQAFLYNDVKEHEESEKYCEILLQLCHEHDLKKEYARSLYIAGYNSFSMDRYGIALEYYYEALPLYKRYYNNEEIGMLYNEIGRTYHRVNNYTKAREFYEKAVSYYDKNAKYYANLAPIYEYLGEEQKALEYFKKAEELAAETEDFVAQALNNANIGNYYENLGNLELAEQHFRKSVEQFESIDWKNYMTQVLIEVGKLEHKKGETEKALETLHRCIELSEEVKRDILLSRCYKEIAGVYEDQGKMAEALRYTHKANEIKEKYYSEELYEKIGELTMRYENSRRELRTRQMLERATHLASIGVMTAGITHEINQPLNVIRICADSLLFSEENNPGTIPESYLEDIEQIAQSANRIEEIIHHLRSYWEKREGDGEIKQQVYLKKRVEAILDLMKRQMLSHGIELQTKFTEPDISISCTKIQLEQIIINLLNNSLQALDREHQKQKIIRLETEQSDGKAILRICDNGAGIEADIIEHIFDPFFTTKSPGKCMGLGLAIVKEILERIGGEIEVKNQAEGGVCFTIRFQTGE